MDWSKWFEMDWEHGVAIAVTGIVLYFGLILFTRLMGLRSFAKISSHDFAMTVAVGSILASTLLSKSPSLSKGLLAIAILFILQGSVSFLRRKVKPFKKAVDNQPIVLMAHGEYFWENIAEASLSKHDIGTVLRKNGIKSKSQVFALVMETTGDMSLIKQDDTVPDIDLFEDIRECEHLINNAKFKRNLAEPLIKD